MRTGSMSASWVNGVLTLWISEELAEKLTNPRVFFNPNNEILIKNDAEKPRKWSSNFTCKDGQVNASFQASKIKGLLPQKNFGKTDFISVKSSVPGHVILTLPHTKAAYIPRARQKKADSVSVRSSPKPQVIPADVKVDAAVNARPVAQAKLLSPPSSPEDTPANAINWSQMSLTQQFREALEVVNRVKKHFGDNMEIRIEADGTVTADLLMKF